jgi:hypothetical protein
VSKRGIALALFAKQFDKPIESVVTAGADQAITGANVDAATNIGRFTRLTSSFVKSYPWACCSVCRRTTCSTCRRSGCKTASSSTTSRGAARLGCRSRGRTDSCAQRGGEGVGNERHALRNKPPRGVDEHVFTLPLLMDAIGARSVTSAFHPFFDEIVEVSSTNAHARGGARRPLTWTH